MEPDSPAPRVVRINVKPTGGVPKQPGPGAEDHAGSRGRGRPRDLRFPGGARPAGPAQSVELDQAAGGGGAPIGPGTTGENLTVSGLEWSKIGPGDRLRIGETV